MRPRSCSSSSADQVVSYIRRQSDISGWIKSWNTHHDDHDICARQVESDHANVRENQDAMTIVACRCTKVVQRGLSLLQRHRAVELDGLDVI